MSYQPSGRCRERFYLKKKVLPGFEPGLQESEPWVLTNYTIEPVQSQEASVAEWLRRQTQVLVNFVGVSSILTGCTFLKGEFQKKWRSRVSIPVPHAC